VIKDLFNYKILYYFINKNECNRKFNVNKELSLETNSISIDAFINASILIIITFMFVYFLDYLINTVKKRKYDKNILSDDKITPSVKDNFFKGFSLTSLKDSTTQTLQDNIIDFLPLFICLITLIIITNFVKANYYNNELINNIKSHYKPNKDNNFLHNIIRREWELIKDNTNKDNFKLLLANSTLHNIDANLKNIDKYDNLFKKIFYLCIFLQKQNDNHNNVFHIMNDILKTYDMKVEPCNITFLDFIGYPNYNSNNKINDANTITILPSLLQSKYLIEYGEKGYNIKDELKSLGNDYYIIKDWLIQLETELGVKTPGDKKYLTNIMLQTSGIIKNTIYIIFILTLLTLIFLIFVIIAYRNSSNKCENTCYKNINKIPYLDKYIIKICEITHNITNSLCKSLIK